MDLVKGGTEPLADEEACALIGEALASEGLGGKSVLVLIPDSTRSFPFRLVFTAIHRTLAGKASKLDFLIALGTHRPMSETAIRAMLGITEEEALGEFADTRVLNHAWDESAALREVGSISGERVAELTQGRFSKGIPLAVNKLLFEYDRVLIAGPVFPHEVVGFSGGHKYIFPGVGAAEFINFFHWFSALLTIPRVIGHKDTSVRAIIEEAAAMMPIRVGAFCFAMRGSELMGISYSDSAYRAWEAAVELSRELNVVYCERPYASVLACAPAMYEDLWTGGKCAYKTECVVADGGELVIYAPHISEVSYTHGKVLDAIGYHVKDYFLSRWAEFERYPWGVLAHSTHVKGIGTCEGGVERPRIRVKLATGIPRERCERINLEYVDYRTIDALRWRQSPDRLFLEHAGETLYRLKDPPEWQRPSRDVGTLEAFRHPI
jgi:nickel-dependent lactate racemase